jgi:Mn-dependent DtxR family transcriptional regulator
MLLEPEQIQVLQRCRRPTAVADLASDLDLPLGVVRIMLADMRERGLITIGKPPRIGLADPRVLKDVADALRRL